VRTLRDAAPAGTAVSGIVGGMFGLVEALTGDLERFGVTVRLGSAVAAVDASTVTLVDGAILHADTVVLATPLVAAGVPAIVLATLVVDAPGLDAAPRGTGVLVARDPVDTQLRAKALTHATAKWEWLAAQTASHRHVLRLSYDGAAAAETSDAGLREQALRDAGTLLGVPLAEASVVAFARVHWSAPAGRPEPIEGVTAIGEGVAGTGLAAVIAQVRMESGRLLEGVEA
jgi:oxygen-dependent protoporphyrinogen oxidase